MLQKKNHGLISRISHSVDYNKSDGFRSLFYVFRPHKIISSDQRRKFNITVEFKIFKNEFKKLINWILKLVKSNPFRLLLASAGRRREHGHWLAEVGAKAEPDPHYAAGHVTSGQWWGSSLTEGVITTVGMFGGSGTIPYRECIIKKTRRKRGRDQNGSSSAPIRRANAECNRGNIFTSAFTRKLECNPPMIFLKAAPRVRISSKCNIALKTRVKWLQSTSNGKTESNLPIKIQCHRVRWVNQFKCQIQCIKDSINGWGLFKYVRFYELSKLIGYWHLNSIYWTVLVNLEGRVKKIFIKRVKKFINFTVNKAGW